MAPLESDSLPESAPLPSPSSQSVNDTSSNVKSAAFVPNNNNKLARVRRSIQGRLPALNREGSILQRISRPRLKKKKKKKKNRTADNIDVRDGRFFHLRVTLGYMTGMTTTTTTSGQSSLDQPRDDYLPSDIAGVYATFEEGNVRKEYNFAISHPLRSVSKQTVQWPRHLDDSDEGTVKTSKRRLYHSILLRTDDTEEASMASGRPASLFDFSDEEDEEEEDEDGSSDSSASIAPPSRYAAAMIPIHLGIVRGQEKIPLGVATLVINGKNAAGRKVDLPVQPVIPQKKAKGKIPKKIKKLLGNFNNAKKKKGNNNNNDIVDTSQLRRSEEEDDDDKVYSIAPNSVLRIKLDIQSGVYEVNGPGLWGDLNDDEESFGPLPVIDIPDDGRGELSNRYVHESIEVMNSGAGTTTILSSPGLGYAEEKVVDSTHRNDYVAVTSPSGDTDIVDRRSANHRGPGCLLCGNVEEDDGHNSSGLKSFETNSDHQLLYASYDHSIQGSFDLSSRGTSGLDTTGGYTDRDHNSLDRTRGDDDYYYDQESSLLDSTLGHSSRGELTAGSLTNALSSVGGSTRYTDGEDDGVDLALKPAVAATEKFIRYASELLPTNGEFLVPDDDDDDYGGSSLDANSYLDSTLSRSFDNSTIETRRSAR